MVRVFNCDGGLLRIDNLHQHQHGREGKETGEEEKGEENNGDEIRSKDNTGAEDENTDGVGGQDNNEDDSSEEAESEEDNVDKRADEVIYLQEIHKHVEPPPIKLATSLAKQVLQFIDDTELVRRFDKARLAARSTTECQIQQQYMHTASNIKEKLTSKFKQLTTEIADWERSFRQQHGSDPSPSDIPEQVANTMLHRRTLKKMVFHEWKQLLT